MQKRFKDEGLVTIGIGFNDTRENIEQYAKDSGLTDIIFTYDDGNRVTQEYGIAFVAGSVFINRQGVVSKVMPSGFNDVILLKETYKILK